MSERGWVTVENAIEILRSPEDVFDHLTDTTKEVEWNPRTRRVEKLTPAPIGLGTRFSAEWIKGNPTIVEYVRFERPTAWASIARSPTPGCGRRGADLADGAGLPSRGQNHTPTQGCLLALLLPLMRRTMHEREGQNLEKIKAILQGTG